MYGAIKAILNSQYIVKLLSIYGRCKMAQKEKQSILNEEKEFNNSILYGITEGKINKTLIDKLLRYRKAVHESKSLCLYDPKFDEKALIFVYCMERKYDDSKEDKYKFNDETCAKSMMKYRGNILGYSKAEKLYKDKLNKIPRNYVPDMVKLGVCIVINSVRVEDDTKMDMNKYKSYG